MCLQQIMTFLVMVFMLIVVFFFFPLVGVVGDPPSHYELDIGGPHLASFMLITTCNPLSRSSHVIVIFLLLPLVATINNPPSCCDIDFGGPSLAFLMLAIGCNPFGHHDLSGFCLTSLVFVTALIFLVVILIFVVLVVVTGNAPGCGLGCNY